MSQKRHPDGSSSSADEKRQKVPALKEVILEALKMNRVQKLLSALEPLVRRVVKEEVEEALAKHLANLSSQCGKQIYPSTSRSLQLQFRNKLSLPIFTGTRIEGEDSSALSIALVDGLTDHIVETGLESSMKIEIVVLEGDFEGNDSWTFEEFKSNVVREREGKRSLLTGDLFLDLNEGVGVIGEISFTDNSSWTRSRKFRLGARVVDGYFNGVRVREAMTEPFMVKDHRGELYKKHYPPLLWDEVWRLEKIGKDGAFHKRLNSENIKSVKDFLTLLSTDASRLRNILGSGMSTKMWEVTVEHARTCMLPDQMYVYFTNGSPERNIETGVVFNIVGGVMGLLSEHQFIPVNDLSESEKFRQLFEPLIEYFSKLIKHMHINQAEAHCLVKLAFDNFTDVVIYDDSGNNSSYPSILPTPLNSNVNTQSIQDSVFFGNFGLSSEAEHAYAIQASLPPMGRTSDPLMLDGCVGTETLFFGEEEDSLQQYLGSDLLTPSLGIMDSQADLGTAVTGFLAMSSARSAARDKANTVWGTLVSVLRWRFSIKKIVATKKRVHMQ